MAWTYGASRCSECGVTKANPAAMRRHTLTQHRHLGRNANRRLPPQQRGPDPALGQTGSGAASTLGGDPAAVARPPPATTSSLATPAAGTHLVDAASLDGHCGSVSDCDADDEALLLQLADVAAVTASQQAGGAPHAAAKPPLGGHDVEVLGGDTHARSSVCTEAQAEYERIGDAKRCRPAVEARPHCKPGLFNTPALRLMQEFIHEANGSGLSTTFQTKFYEMMAKWDGSADDRRQTGPANKIKDHFPSANAFRNAVRDDLDEAVLSAGWMRCTMVQGGVQYVSFFRSGLHVAVQALRNAQKVQLRRDDNEVGDRRESPMDGEALKAHQEAIDNVTVEKAFVLGVHVYSDASLLSWSGAHYLYPVRIRVVNDVTGDDQWYTVAYVPWVRTLKEPGGKEKAKGRRWGVLQRTLYLAFRDAINASHKGHTLDKSIDGYNLAFFRVLLYACDRPEERSVLCLKAGKCTYPCTSCMVRADDACTEAGVNAADRDVVKTLERHLEAVHLSRTTKKRKRRVMLETASSINAFVPALAALGGLGTVPHHLYKMIAFDPLHVLDLGITRMLCHRLILVFSHVCKEYYPEFKDESTTARAGNTRTEFLGRRSLASFIPPGYLVGPKEKQATFTGRQQRAGVWFLAFLVAGLFGPGTRRRPPPKKKQKERAATKHGGAKTPMPVRRRPPPASSSSRRAQDLGRATVAGGDNDQDVDDIIESLLRADADGSSNSDGGGNASGASSSAGSAGEDSDGPKPATTSEKPDGDDVGDECGNEDESSVYQNLAFDWDLYRSKFGDMPYKVAVTHMFVKYAELVDRLVGTFHCRPPMTVAEGEEVARLSRSFVLDILTPVLGKVFSTKVHKLLAHVLDAIKLHGAIKNGDTGSNEALHGNEKRRYCRTNKDEDNFRAQLLRVGQGTLEIKSRQAREDAEFDEWFDDGGDVATVATAVPDCGVDTTGRGVASRRTATITLDELAARPGLSAVGFALNNPAGTAAVRTANSYTFSPRYPCCAGGHPKQHLRAAPLYRGLPWFDGVAYNVPGDSTGLVRYGEARSIVRAVAGAAVDVVVVAGMDICESMPGCPLVGGGCARLCWSMEVGDEWPALHAIPLTSVLRLEHIVPDQDQITRDHGITATPKTVRDTAGHRRRARFFVNAFYPWP